MLYLNGDEMERTVSCAETMAYVEEAYRVYRSGKFTMPERPHVSQGSKQLYFMPCFTETAMGTKVLTMFPENVALGKPSIHSQMLVNDAVTGEFLAAMDGARLTAMRTGAAGGLGVKYLSAEGSRTLGIVGAGAQGRYQAIYAAHARPSIETVFVYDNFVKDFAPFQETVQSRLNRRLEFVVCKSSRQLAEASDIIITATMSAEPVLPDAPELLANKCFVGVGSYRPDLRELPAAIWKVCREVYVDLEFASVESGDISQPLAQGLLRQSRIKLLSSLFGKAPGEEVKPGAGRSTFFKTVGMALVDVLLADAIRRLAEERGYGKEV